MEKGEQSGPRPYLKEAPLSHRAWCRGSHGYAQSLPVEGVRELGMGKGFFIFNFLKICKVKGCTAQEPRKK